MTDLVGLHVTLTDLTRKFTFLFLTKCLDEIG